MADGSKWDRVEAAVHHQTADRIPWALWRHFYHREHTAEDLAAAMLEWEHRYDFDLLKVNPRAQYHAEVWGARYVPSSSPLTRPRPDYLPVGTARDWLRIEEQSPVAGPLDEQLRALSLIRRGLGGGVPFVQTVFTPLAVAGYLIADPQLLVRHMQEAPEALHQALQAITATFRGFVQEVLNAGAAGIFLATTNWATSDTLSAALYAEFGTPYDLQVLAAAREAPLNVLHVCRAHNMLRALLEYPVQILNWAVTEEGNPSLAEIADLVPDRAVAGGVSPGALIAADADQALREADAAAEQAAGRGLILAGNCSIPATASAQVLDALHRWITRH
jgi:uroporphyrinogen decarboxylase